MNQVERRFERFADFVAQYSSRLSLGGMFLETEEIVPVGSALAIEFHLSDDFRLFRGEGEVLWVRPTDEHGSKGVGVRFRKLDEAGRNLVLKVLEEHVKGGGEPFDVEELPPGARIATLQVEKTPPAPPAPAEPEGEDFGAPWGHELPDLPDELLEEGRGERAAAAADDEPGEAVFDGDVPPLRRAAPEAPGPAPTASPEPEAIFEVEEVGAVADLGEEDGPRFETDPALDPATLRGPRAKAASAAGIRTDTARVAAEDPGTAAEVDFPIEPAGEHDWSDLEGGAPPADEEPEAAPVEFEEVDWDGSAGGPEEPDFGLGAAPVDPDQQPTVSFDVQATMLGGGGAEGPEEPDFGTDDSPDFGDETFAAAEEMTGFRLPEDSTGSFEAPDDPFGVDADDGEAEAVSGGGRSGRVAEPVDLDASLLSNVDEALGDPEPPAARREAPRSAGAGAGPSLFGTEDWKRQPEPLDSAPSAPAPPAPAAPPPASAARRAISPAEAAMAPPATTSPPPASVLAAQYAWSEDDRPGKLTRFFDTLQERWIPLTGALVLVAVLAGAWFERDRLLQLVGKGDPEAAGQVAEADLGPEGAAEGEGAGPDGVAATSETPGLDPTAENPGAATDVSEPPVTRIGPPEGTGGAPAAGPAEVTVTAAPPPPSPPPPPVVGAARGRLATALADLGVRQEAGSTRVVLAFDGALPDARVKSYRLSGGAPRELVILQGLQEPYRQAAVPAGTPGLERVRTGFHQKPTGPELHVVLDLASSGVSTELVRIGEDRIEILVSGASR